jgi:hypothetical protein
MSAGADVSRMDVSDILDRAVAHYRRHFVTLLGVYAVGYAPFWLLIALAVHFLSGGLLMALDDAAMLDDSAFNYALLGMFGAFAVFSALVFLIEPIVTGATARAVSEQILHRDVGVWDAYSAVRPRIPALLLSSLVRILAVYGGSNLVGAIAMLPAMVMGTVSDLLSTVLLLVGQLVGLLVASLLFVYLAFIGQIIAIENRGTADALTRSWRLVSGSLWRTAGILGLVVLLVAALAAAVQAVLIAAALFLLPLDFTPEAIAYTLMFATTVLGLSSLLVSPVMSIAATLMYYDLRVRREGFDVQLMAAHLAGEPAQ